MSWLGQSLYESAAMFWEVLWALVLGFALSAALQVFVSKDRMTREFGTTSFRSVALATLLRCRRRCPNSVQEGRVAGADFGFHVRLH